VLGRTRLVFVLAALAVGVGSQAGASAAETAQLPSPGGFQLPASNGYSLRAISYDGDPRGERDSLLLFFGRKGSAALYFAQKGVEVTEESISADLGGLGSIDLRFVPTGQARDEAPKCIHQSVAVDSGVYEGRVEFRGEEGFTEVHAVRARGEVRFALGLICAGGGDEGAGGHSPGARLLVHRKRPSGNYVFEAWKNSPTRPAYFEASVDERRGALRISRSVSSSAGAASFEFDVPAQTALVRPPTPFDGSARFERRGREPGRLQGGLKVDFPGRSNVFLAGTRGGLIRYVRNPAHPFRLTGFPASPSTKP
jgi:hypothetical protein